MSNQPTEKEAFKVLVVEDEILIADTLRVKLQRQGYEVVGIAISYEEAVEKLTQFHPDVVLIDIRLSGKKTGVNVAEFISRQPNSPPFVFLTSQTDKRFIGLAKQTHPAGYLSKPINLGSLFATLEVVLFNANSKQRVMNIKHHKGHQLLDLDTICYLQSEHVYVRIIVKKGPSILRRGTLAELLRILDSDRMLRIHRSYAINMDQITGYDGNAVYFGQERIPISRNRQREVLRRLSAVSQH